MLDNPHHGARLPHSLCGCGYFCTTVLKQFGWVLFGFFFIKSIKTMHLDGSVFLRPDPRTAVGHRQW